MERSILIIHNPVAGQRTAAKVHAVVAALRACGCAVTVKATARAGEAEEIVRAERGGQYGVIALAGGDGTLREGVNGLLACDDQKLAIIPAGTANVVAIELGLPASADGLAQILANGRTRCIKTASANGRRFVFTAGAGFDAQVVASVNPELKRHAGKLAFVAAAAQQLMSAPRAMFQASIDGSMHMAAGVIVMNGRYYGGPFVASPGNELCNGTLCVLALLHTGRRAALCYQAALGLGRLHEAEGVTFFQGVRHVEVTGPDGGPFQADGDHAGQLPVSIRADAGTVNIVC